MPKYGKLLTEEERTKIVLMRFQGKSWAEVAKTFERSVSTGKTWGQAKWFKSRMAVLRKKDGKEEPETETKEEPETETKKEPEVKTPQQKAKEKAQSQIDKETNKHLRGSDPAPKDRKIEPKKDEDTVEDKDKKKEPKKRQFGLLAVIILIVILGVVGFILFLKRRKPEEETPKEEQKGQPGFEGQYEEDL